MILNITSNYRYRYKFISFDVDVDENVDEPNAPLNISYLDINMKNDQNVVNVKKKIDTEPSVTGFSTKQT